MNIQDQTVIVAPDADAFPEAAKFSAWYKRETQAGMFDIKFFTGDLSDATLESFFKEVNQAIEAPTVADPDIF